MNLKPIKFISEEITPLFDKTPTLGKKPPCPDGFVWQGETFRVDALLSQWQDFTRRGRFARNMRPTNQRKTAGRGSFGVGRFYFQVCEEGGRIFELYFDREPKSVDDKVGRWMLFRELVEA